MTKSNKLKIWDVTLIRIEMAGDLLIAAETEKEAYQIARQIADSGDDHWLEVGDKEEAVLYKENPEISDLEETENYKVLEDKRVFK